MDYIYLGLSILSLMGLWSIISTTKGIRMPEVAIFWILLILFVFFGNQYIHTLIK